MNKENIYTKVFFAVTILTGLLLLYYSSTINYLIFHTFAEIISVGISLTIFIIVFNSSEIISNVYLKIIGLAYFSIAILDTLHALAYEGMILFKPDHYYANQLWIGTRFFEALVMLVAFLFINTKVKKDIRKEFLIAIYSGIMLSIILSIFYWDIFPECFVRNVGQTKFKIYSEYVITFIFLLNLFFLIRQRSYFPQRVYKYLRISFLFYAATEIAFIQYVSNYGFTNLLGHYFKLVAFYFSYKALIETSIKEPYNIIFKELSEKKEQLEEMNRMKNKLFTIIGHDLRSPLASIKSTLDFFTIQGQEYDEEQVKELFPLLRKSTLSAMDLLDNLLQWSLSQSNALEVKKELFSVNNLFEENAELFSSIVKQKNLKIVFHVENSAELIGYADKNMITTVLRNLISNAVKYSYSGGDILVEARQNDSHIIISVSDSGVGIGKENPEKLFEFNTNTSTHGTNGEKGTGLGLVLCKDFVTKNKGKIWADSTYGNGSTFYFTFLRGKNGE